MVFGITLIVYSIFILTLILLMTTELFGVRGNTHKNARMLKKKLKEYNQPYKCRCGIVSRYYQLTGDYIKNCPQCKDTISQYISKVEDNRNFPFAPKLNIKELKKHIDRENELKKIKKEMQDIIEIDKEIEAWEKLQLKKIAEYELKAEELKKELLAKQ